MHQINEYKDVLSSNNYPKFEVGQPVMVRNHACCTFEPKYLLDYQVLQIPNASTILLLAPDGKEMKMNINSVNST